MVQEFRTMDRACISNRLPSIVVRKQPQLGVVRAESGMTFSHFRPENDRSHCNTRRHPTRIVTYTARNGAKGIDNISYDVLWHDGVVWQGNVEIDVR